MRTPATVGTTSSSPSALSLWTATKNVPTLLFPITAPSAPSPPTISKVIVGGGDGDVTTRLSSLDRYDLARRASLNRHLRTIEQPNVIVQISPRHHTQQTLDARQTASRPNTASAPAAAAATTSASLASSSLTVNASPAVVPVVTSPFIRIEESKSSSLPLPSLNIDNIDRSEQQLTTDERKLLIYDSAYQARQKVLRRALEALEQKRIEKQRQKQQEAMAEQLRMQAAASEPPPNTASDQPVSDKRIVENKSFDNSPIANSDAPLSLSLPAAVVNAINNTTNNDVTPNSARTRYGSLSARTSEKSRPRKELVTRRLSIQTITPVKSATERRPSFPQYYSSRAPTASAVSVAPTSRQSDLVTERAMERLRQQRDAQKRAELDKARRLAESERVKEEDRERRRHLAHAASMAEQKRQQRLVQQKEAELKAAEEARNERAAALTAKQQQRYAEDDRRRKVEDAARQEAEAERQRAEEYRQQSAAAAAERRRNELLQRAAELKRSEEDNVTSRQYSSQLAQSGLYVVYDPSQQQQHSHIQLIDGHTMSNIQ